MNQIIKHRPKYWWLWPDFYEEKDARDGAMMGVIACSLVAVVTGFTCIYRYYIGGDFYQLPGGMVVFVIYCVLGYGIFKMSRTASSVALILFLTEKIYTIGVQGCMSSGQNGQIFLGSVCDLMRVRALVVRVKIVLLPPFQSQSFFVFSPL